MSLVLLNKAIAGVTFSLIAGSPFSQRCRCALTYTIVPGIAAFAMYRLVTGVDLLSELAFYSKFHMDPRNVLIHAIFVPLILWTAMVWMAYAPPLSKVKILGQPFNFAHVAALAYTVFHVQCDPLLGSAAAALWWAFAFTATRWIESREGAKKGAKAKPSWAPGTCAKVAGGLHILSWYMQLHPGHKVFEGRKPALLDGMVQSFSVAPLFVFYEGAFALGYRPELSAAVHESVAAQLAAM